VRLVIFTIEMCYGAQPYESQSPNSILVHTFTIEMCYGARPCASQIPNSILISSQEQRKLITGFRRGAKVI
jgi:hypothetical protein